MSRLATQSTSEVLYTEHVYMYIYTCVICVGINSQGTVAEYTLICASSLISSTTSSMPPRRILLAVSVVSVVSAVSVVSVVVSEEKWRCNKLPSGGEQGRHTFSLTPPCEQILKYIYTCTCTYAIRTTAHNIRRYFAQLHMTCIEVQSQHIFVVHTMYMCTYTHTPSVIYSIQYMYTPLKFTTTCICTCTYTCIC